MFYTYQCVNCKKHAFPKRAVCPFCYTGTMLPHPDSKGVVTNYTVDQRTKRILSVVQTQNNVTVITESLHVIPIDQAVYIKQDNNKIISTLNQETSDEKNT